MRRHGGQRAVGVGLRVVLEGLGEGPEVGLVVAVAAAVTAVVTTVLLSTHELRLRYGGSCGGGRDRCGRALRLCCAWITSAARGRFESPDTLRKRIWSVASEPTLEAEERSALSPKSKDEMAFDLSHVKSDEQGNEAARTQGSGASPHVPAIRPC